MPGHHVHGAWGPCVVTGGRIYAGTGLYDGRDTEGTILIVSTPAHDLRDYLVYTSDGCWSMAPQLQDWGTNFATRPRSPKGATWSVYWAGAQSTIASATMRVACLCMSATRTSGRATDTLSMSCGM